MDAELTGAGIISEISTQFGAITACVNGIQENLQFDKKNLYVFGIPCDGDMTNILEEGMEVDFRCIFSKRLKKHVVTVIWIGDEPDSSILDESLKAVYGLNGRVNQILVDGNFLVVCEKRHRSVFISQEVTYANGVSTKINISVGDYVMFDATPLKVGHSSGAMYVATCAWIGKDPRLVDRFRLKVGNRPAESEERLKALNIVYGIVEVIPNDAVAFVKVENIEDKIVLFRSSFNGGVERLRDVVEVGDPICMNLRFECISSGHKQWFGTNARKCDSGTNDLEDSVETLTTKVEKFELAAVEEQKFGLAEVEEQKFGLAEVEEQKFEFAGVEEQKFGFAAVEEQKFEFAGVEEQKFEFAGVKEQNFESAEVVEHSPSLINYYRFTMPIDEVKADENTSFLFRDPPLIGVIHHLTKKKTVAVIKYDTLFIRLRLCDFYINGSPCFHPKVFISLSQPGITRVNFEAVFSRDPYHRKKMMRAENYTHDATCAWIGQKPKFDVVAMVVNNQPAVGKLKKKNTICRGKIARLLFPDRAVVQLLESQTVCLHLSLFVPENFSGAVIADFVHLGDWLLLTVVRNDDCSFPVCARDVMIVPKSDLKRTFFDKRDYNNYDSDVSEDGIVSSFTDGTKPEVLFKFPALAGLLQANIKILNRISSNSARICSEFGRVLVRRSNMYLCGDMCTESEFVAIVKYGQSILNYEALVDSKNRYDATCAWIGKKPSLIAVVSHLKLDLSITQLKDCVFIGEVKKFYLPEVAVIQIHDCSIVCLHVSAFGVEPKSMAEYSDSGEGLITDFVRLNECIEFRVRLNPNCPLRVCAYDVKKSTVESFREFAHSLRLKERETKEIRRLATFRVG